MNNPDALLAQLRDIHLPEPVSWWPPAPGWWILTALLIAAVLILFGWIRARSGKTTPIDESLRQLKQLPEQASKDDLVQTLHLFRRAALAYLPREEAASIPLAKLAEQLAAQHGLSLSAGSLALMRDAQYRPSTEISPQEWQRLIQEIQLLIPLLPKTKPLKDTKLQTARSKGQNGTQTSDDTEAQNV